MAYHQYSDIQISTLDAGSNQQELIESVFLVRRLLGRVAYETFETPPGRSLFRLQSDGEDEMLVGEHYFPNGDVDITMHTVRAVPRDLEDREFIGLDDVSDPEEFLRIVSQDEVAECSYVLEPEYEDHPDIEVIDAGDITALEALIAADSLDADAGIQKAS